MLVISRRKGQRITIGDEIELIVTELHRSSVKVGIRAPRGYAVLRGEVHDTIATANRAAAETTLEDSESLDESLGLPPASEAGVELLALRPIVVKADRPASERQPTERQVQDTTTVTEVIIRRPRLAARQANGNPDPTEGG